MIQRLLSALDYLVEFFTLGEYGLEEQPEPDHNFPDWRAL